MTERFLTGAASPREAHIALLEHVANVLAAANVPRLGAGVELVGTGGTIKAIARMEAHRVEANRSGPKAGIHGASLSSQSVEQIGDRLAEVPASALTLIGGVRKGRADSIVAGALVVRALMEYLGAPRLVVSRDGLAEGVAIGRELARSDQGELAVA